MRRNGVMNRPLTRAAIAALPVEDRLRLMEDIWDTLDDVGVEQPVPEWQQQILEDRLDEHLRNPGASRPWHEVEADLLRSLRK